jgi:hypothetical protein
MGWESRWERRTNGAFVAAAAATVEEVDDGLDVAGTCASLGHGGGGGKGGEESGRGGGKEDGFGEHDGW